MAATCRAAAGLCLLGLLGLAVSASAQDLVVRIVPLDERVETNALLQVVQGRDGIVYALESRGTRVLAFDGTGAFLREHGRAGAGPGEFRAVRRIGVFGDTLFVFDQLLSRETGFVGTAVAAERRVTQAGVRLAGAALSLHARLADGRYLASENRSPANPDFGAAGSKVALVRDDGSATLLDSLDQSQFWYAIRTPNGGVLQGLQRWGQSDRVASSADGRWVVIVKALAPPTRRAPGTFTITRHDLVSGRSSSDTLQRSPPELDPSVVDALIAEQLPQLAQVFGGAGAARSVLRDAILAPPTYPMFADAVALRDGSVLLRTPDATSREVWTLYAHGNVPRRVLRLPANTLPTDGDASVLWGAALTQGDLPALLRVELP